MYISISSYTYTYRYIHIHINIYIHTSSTATTTMTHPHIHRGGEALETKESQQHQKQAEPHHSHNHRGGGDHDPSTGGGGWATLHHIYIYLYEIAINSDIPVKYIPVKRRQIYPMTDPWNWNIYLHLDNFNSELYRYIFQFHGSVMGIWTLKSTDHQEFLAARKWILDDFDWQLQGCPFRV